MLYIRCISRRLWNKRIQMIGIFALFFQSTVYAYDAKVYPALMCVENGVETGSFNRSMHRVTRVNNKGSGILLCPIVRDSIDDNSGKFKSKNLVQVKVTTYRTDPAPKIRLTLRKLSNKGVVIEENTAFPLGGHQSTLLSVKFKKDDGYYILEVEMGVNKKDEYAKLFSYKFIE